MPRFTIKERDRLLQVINQLKNEIQNLTTENQRLVKEGRDLRAALDPESSEGQEYKSELIQSQERYREITDEFGHMIDHLMRARHALENVCSAVSHNQHAVAEAREIEKAAMQFLLAKMRER